MTQVVSEEKYTWKIEVKRRDKNKSSKLIGSLSIQPEQTLNIIQLLARSILNFILKSVYLSSYYPVQHFWFQQKLTRLSKRQAKTQSEEEKQDSEPDSAMTRKL